MKLILVGYLENINSDRRIIDSSGMRMDVLYLMKMTGTLVLTERA